MREIDTMKILAHLFEDPPPWNEQSLTDHCRSVAKLASVSLESIGLSQLGYLCGLVHDMGKASPDFQTYIRSEDSSLRGKINHSTAGARYIWERWGQHPGPTQLAAQIAVISILSHHGHRIDVLSPNGEFVMKKRLFPHKDIAYEKTRDLFLSQCIPASEIEQAVTQASHELTLLCAKIKSCVLGHSPKDNLFYQSLPAKEKTDEENYYIHQSLRYFLGLISRLAFSALVDADWEDTGAFGEHRCPQPVRESVPWDFLQSHLEDRLSALPQKGRLTPYRRQISDLCLSASQRGPGIYRLSAPTGGGKTFASLRYGIACCKNQHAPHLFYIAPFRSILSQNAGSIQSVLPREYRDSQSFPHPCVLEHHSDVTVDSNSQEGEAMIRHMQRWDRCPVVLTTTVQLLNTLFAAPRQNVRRMASLVGSVLIFDEVQSIPAKMQYLFNMALNFLADVCGCTILLCTATQPESQHLAFPLWPMPQPDLVPFSVDRNEAFRRTRVLNMVSSPDYSCKEIAQLTLEKLRDAPHILVVLNTKLAVRNLYQALREVAPDCQLFHLSTSQCSSHREHCIREIRDALPDPQKPLICVSTPLIEAGVDLSFDCVIRSLAGLDSIAQAAGRCNRHGESDIRDVLLIQCREESLNRLPDIRWGQEATLAVLDSHPADLLSPEAIQMYYHRYFLTEQMKNTMGYPLPSASSESQTLFDLLGYNSYGLEACREENGGIPSLPLWQAFETAETAFEAIEGGGHTVLVPYGKGEELIEKLASNPPIYEIGRILREAQPFCVTLFEHEYKSLCEKQGLYPLAGGSIYALQPCFYDDAIGVCLEPCSSPLLFV